MATKKTKNITQQWNDYFMGLSKSQRRVAIATDVIESVKKGVYKTGYGYVTLQRKPTFAGALYDLDFQSNLDKIAQCHVCALGGCLVSMVKYIDGATIGELDGGGNAHQWERLNDYFSARQMALIEGVYERWTTTLGIRSGERQGVAGHEFKYHLTKGDMHILNTSEKLKLFPNDKEQRLKKIMENIVRNDGEFKPLQG